MAGETIAILNTTKQTVLGERIRVAETALSRMVGLLRDRGLEPGCGLLIYPSQAIHTVAMRFPIDVLFVDRDWRVVHARPNMVPFRLTGIHWKARCVLELPSGVIADTSTTIGDQLCVTQ
jgi:uncharacterized membrane protein (UPF0127 family)